MIIAVVSVNAFPTEAGQFIHWQKVHELRKTVLPVYMSHPSNNLGVAIGRKKFQVDKKKKRTLVHVII